MDKTEIVALLESVAIPVYQIEANLGMPKTTLQKAIKGERKLPKKWCIALNKAYATPKKEIAAVPPPKDKETLKEGDYDFSEDLFLNIEKHTKYPKKNAPKNGWEKSKWETEKQQSDNLIRTAWHKYQQTKNQ